MNRSKNMLMTAIVVALVMAGNTVFAAAQGANAKLLIGNGTGGEITALVISPAKKKYPNKNENCLAFQNITVEDKASFAVVLSEQFKGVDTFDIEIVSNGKRFVTQKGVKIDLKNGKVPTLELSRKGKDSTRALVEWLCKTGFVSPPGIVILGVCSYVRALTPGELAVQVYYN